jgi:hypothetical protein
MNAGLKRNFFPLKMVFPVAVLILVFSLIYGGSFFRGAREAQANMAIFQPAHCLGGWKMSTELRVSQTSGQMQIRTLTIQIPLRFSIPILRFFAVALVARFLIPPSTSE